MANNENISSNAAGQQTIDFEVLERQLSESLNQELSDLDVLRENKDKIGSPEALGDTILNVVWEQFINQVGVAAGETFIEQNKGLTLDLRDEAHIQTTENFAEGNIATHNTHIDYQKRYDDWQTNFQKDENGNVKTRVDNRTGKTEMILQKSARRPFDENRPKGNGNIDIDHTVSAAEIMRDPEANAHLSKEEQVAFANSEANLNAMDSAANQSKKDSKMEDWLDSERDGKKPAERFNIEEEKLREKDRKARKEYKKCKETGKRESAKTGKESQKEEALRMGSNALKAAVMGLLADLLKTIVRKLLLWLKEGKKNIETLIDYIKASLRDFVANLRQHLSAAADASFTSILTALIGPIADTLKKVWMILKTSIKSIREAIHYIKQPENRNKSIGCLLLEAAKIVMAGMTAIGAITLGEIIGKSLMAFPLFMIEIPLLGSLASLVGMFIGAVVAGIVGALIIRLIDHLTEKYQKRHATEQKIDKGNNVLLLQKALIKVKGENQKERKNNSNINISNRHQNAMNMMKASLANVVANENDEKNDDKFDQMNHMLDNL